ncbi:cyclic nucleotide-binding domain-containing protein [Oceanibaculum nanhaiense]|uniref:cyclic nucleotide-binding domain-containing protein n=1 Tax=Oceanibaculum nanhaiense TaxID=1909734 RepID=UPI00396D0929
MVFVTGATSTGKLHCDWQEGALGSPCNACQVRGLTICAPLSHDDLQHMVSIVSERQLEPGGTLFSEGDPADHLFNITAGTIMVYRLLADGRRQITGFLFPGDFLGLGSDHTYRYSAEALTPATVCRFKRPALQEALEKFPTMEKRLFGMASNELAAAQDQMVLLGRKTAQEKLASFLLMLSRRAERRGQKPTPIPLAMNRSEIGDYLGLTIETTSRVFTKMKQSGVIALLPSSHIDIRDFDALEELAEQG